MDFHTRGRSLAGLIRVFDFICDHKCGAPAHIQFQPAGAVPDLRSMHFGLGSTEFQGVVGCHVLDHQFEEVLAPFLMAQVHGDLECCHEVAT